MNYPRRWVIAVLVFCALAVVGSAMAIPVIQVHQRDVQQAERARQGVALLHTFDCTYGKTLKEVARFAAVNYRDLAAQTKQLIKALEGRRAFQAATVQRRIYKQQLAAAARFDSLAAGLPILDGGGPCSSKSLSPFSASSG